VAGGVNEAAKSIAKIIKWAPYVVAGIGVVGMTAVVLAASHRPIPIEPEREA
jgi:cobalamin biosynthesis protein CbiG